MIIFDGLSKVGNLILAKTNGLIFLSKFFFGFLTRCCQKNILRTKPLNVNVYRVCKQIKLAKQKLLKHFLWFGIFI